MSYNQELLDHLHWYTNRMGVQLLALSPEPKYGFRKVLVNDTHEFYGVAPRPQFDFKDLSTTISQQEAIEQGLLVGNHFIDDFWYRMVSISRDKLARTRDPNNIRGFGSEFYNGELARFQGLSILPGNSDLDPILAIEIGRTSHFTSVATTQTIGGYSYEYSSDLLTEPPLRTEENWVGEKWDEEIKSSRLANTLSIQLMLYNDFEIIYVRRGKVGIWDGVLNSTVNGVVEVPQNAHEKDAFEKDPIGYCARRETLDELYLDIDSNKIKWLACAATLDESRVSLLGMIRIEKRAKEILNMIEGAREGREVEEIKFIPRKYSLSEIPISFQPIPWVGFNLPNVAWKKKIGPATLKKILNTTRKSKLEPPDSDVWHPLGAATLLLVLAALRPSSTKRHTDVFVETLREVRHTLS